MSQEAIPVPTEVRVWIRHGCVRPAYDRSSIVERHDLGNRVTADSQVGGGATECSQIDKPVSMRLLVSESGGLFLCAGGTRDEREEQCDCDEHHYCEIVFHGPLSSRKPVQLKEFGKL